MKELGYSVDAVILQTPVDEILRRSMDSNRVGFHAEAADKLPYFLKHAEEVSDDEGFDQIYIKEWEPENSEVTQEIKPFKIAFK